MILNLLLFISFFDIFLRIYGNEKFHLGIINHHTEWHFHCPQNNTKKFNPPSNDQPLISYDCPYPLSTIEILPIEIDFTFLCRLQPRLIWIIIDLYQYNTFSWLINQEDIQIKLLLNDQLEINTSKSEINNYTNRFILINAFYIPFESIDRLLHQQIEMKIEIRNFHQLNRCQFVIKDNYFWKTFIENYCDSTQSKTLSIQSARCDFYSNKLKPIDTNLQVEDHILITTTTTSSIPDLNIILSIDENSTTTTTITTTTATATEMFTSEKNSTYLLTTSSLPYYHYFFLREENYRQILESFVRSTKDSSLLKLICIIIIIILIVLIIFFLYMLCYHYHIRSRSTSLVRKSTVSI